MSKHYQTTTRYVSAEEMDLIIEKDIADLQLRKQQLTRQLAQVEEVLNDRLQTLENRKKYRQQQEERKQLLAAQGLLPDSPVAREPNR
jgi:hypothetical protein